MFAGQLVEPVVFFVAGRLPARGRFSGGDRSAAGGQRRHGRDAGVQKSEKGTAFRR
jgi:hypothetical protein